MVWQATLFTKGVACETTWEDGYYFMTQLPPPSPSPLPFLDLQARLSQRESLATMVWPGRLSPSLTPTPVRIAFSITQVVHDTESDPGWGWLGLVCETIDSTIYGKTNYPPIPTTSTPPFPPTRC